MLPTRKGLEGQVSIWPRILHRSTVWSVGLVIVTLALSLVLFGFVATAPFGACVRGTNLSESLQRTVTALDGTVDLGIKFSTTLAGLGAAAIIGLKPVPLRHGTRMVLLISVLIFIQSALYGVWWRLGIAQAWLNECLNLIVEPQLQARYQAHFDLFLAGLVSLGIFVVSAVLTQKSAVPGKDDT